MLKQQTFWEALLLLGLVTAAEGADYGQINGRELKVGDGDKVNVEVDAASQFKLAHTGAQVGHACQDAGALVNDDSGLPLLCYNGKWSRLLPLSVDQMVDCLANEFVTIKGHEFVCRPFNLGKEEKTDALENLICYKPWERGNSPFSAECPMAYAADLTSALDFKNIQANAKNGFGYKFSLNDWARNGHLKYDGATIANELRNDGDKGSFEREISLASVNLPYFLLARLEKGGNVGKTITLVTSNQERVIELSSSVNQYSMFALNKKTVEGKDRYQVLAAYFRDTSTNDEFKDGYYKLITLAEGEVPQQIIVRYEYTGDGEAKIYNLSAPAVYEFNPR